MDSTLPDFKLDELEGQQIFSLDHVFSASAADLFDAFTSADQLAQWFGPEGWTVPRETVVIDPRVGGTWRFTMVNAENPEMVSPSDAIFINLLPGKLIEGVQIMPQGSESDYFYMRVEFIPRADKTTRLRITQGPLPPEIHGHATEGWVSSYRKLERLLQH